jgi:hypothetical protein
MCCAVSATYIHTYIYIYICNWNSSYLGSINLERKAGQMLAKFNCKEGIPLYYEIKTNRYSSEKINHVFYSGMTTRFGLKRLSSGYYYRNLKIRYNLGQIVLVVWYPTWLSKIIPYLRYNSNRIIGVRGMSTSHIYSVSANCVGKYAQTTYSTFLLGVLLHVHVVS